MSRKQFNIVRAVFWLVTSIIAVHLLVVVTGVGMCVYYSEKIVEGKFQCDPKGRLMEILNKPFDFIELFQGKSDQNKSMLEASHVERSEGN